MNSNTNLLIVVQFQEEDIDKCGATLLQSTVSSLGTGRTFKDWKGHLIPKDVLWSAVDLTREIGTHCCERHRRSRTAMEKKKRIIPSTSCVCCLVFVSKQRHQAGFLNIEMKKRQQPGSPHCLCETLAQNKWSNRPFFPPTLFLYK